MLYRSFLELPVSSKTHFSKGDTGIHYRQIRADGSRRVVYSNRLEHLKNFYL